MTDVLTPKLTASRPTITIGGTANGALAEGLLRLRIHESADGLFSCEATFGNWGTKDNRTSFLYFDRRLVEFGRELIVGLGSETLFQGRISALEADFPPGGTPRITVLAEDRHQDLRMTRRTRTFVDVSDADVFTRVATDHGLTADVRLPGPRHRLLAQLNQSDLAFLRDRARAIDAELWMVGGKLLARPRSERAGATRKLGYGHGLREFTVRADVAGQRSRVRVTGWDSSAKRALVETADASALAGEITAGTGGSAVLGTAFAERVETVVHSVPLSHPEAKSRAETLYRRIARRFVTGTGVAETSVGLRTGCKATVDGLGDLFSGEYYVTEVTHRFDDEAGLRTDFRAERPWLGVAR